MVFDMEVLTTRACEGNGVSREEALWLYNEVDLETLSQAAEKIRKAQCGNHADLCTFRSM